MSVIPDELGMLKRRDEALVALALHQVERRRRKRIFSQIEKTDKK